MAVRAPRKASVPVSRATLGRSEDRRLAAMAAAGEEAAFEAIFDRHHRGLLMLCRQMLGSREEAEDVVQHTFAAAYRQLVEAGPPLHLRAWLYATARNRCLDVLRARREVPAAMPPAPAAGLPDQVEERSDLRELVADIGRLPEDQRAALVLSEIEDMQHAEVAEVLGCGREKVRALVYQARRALAGWREARALPCQVVREEIAVASGGELRRAHLRRHLKVCPECAAFRKEVERQRRGIALILPVLPALGLKERVVEAAIAGGSGLGGTGAAAGTGAAGTGAAGAGAAGTGAGVAGTALKVGAVAVVLGGAGLATFGPPADRDPGSPARPDSPPSQEQRTQAGAPATPSVGPDPRRRAGLAATFRRRREQAAAARRRPGAGSQTAQSGTAQPAGATAGLPAAQGQLPSLPSVPNPPPAQPPAVDRAPAKLDVKAKVEVSPPRAEVEPRVELQAPTVPPPPVPAPPPPPLPPLP
jgi:RNA polymerase sigma factor (sigma-70 family)